MIGSSVEFVSTTTQALQNWLLVLVLLICFCRYTKLTQTYSQSISPDSSSDGCSFPASTRTVGGTLSAGTTRVTHGDLKESKYKSFLVDCEPSRYSLAMEPILRLWHVYQTPEN